MPAEDEIVVRLRVPPTLRHRLPAFSGAKEIDVTLKQGARVADLARAVGADIAQMELVCVLNDRVVAADSPLQRGDQVRFVVRLAGG